MDLALAHVVFNIASHDLDQNSRIKAQHQFFVRYILDSWVRSVNNLNRLIDFKFMAEFENSFYFCDFSPKWLFRPVVGFSLLANLRILMVNKTKSNDSLYNLLK